MFKLQITNSPPSGDLPQGDIFQKGLVPFETGRAFGATEAKRFQMGFTLIEAMVALVILTTALGPMLYLANSAVNSAYIIRDNMIASGLAQEGVEVVRAIRDANWLNNRSFDIGLADGTYRVEWNSSSLLALSSNPPLKLDNGLYNYSFGVITPFSRTIKIEHPSVSSNEIRVTSTVSWELRGGSTKTIQAESHLFNWK